MNFELSDERRMLQETARAWTNDALVPEAQHLDTLNKWPEHLWSQAQDLGLTAIMAPEASGGFELSLIDLMLTITEISRGNASLALALGWHNLACCHSSAFDDHSIDISAIAAGERLIGLVWPDEPISTSNAAAPSATATSSSSQYWHILCPAAECSFAWISSTENHDFIDLPARLPPWTPSALTELRWHLDIDAAQLFSNAGKTPTAASIGGLCLIAAAVATGISQQAVTESAAYALERQQFGQPLARFQDIQWMIADSTMLVEAARNVLYRAAWSMDTTEAGAESLCLHAKLAADTAARAACAKAIQIHGGYGYTKDYPVERLFRQAQLLATFPWSSCGLRQRWAEIEELAA